MILSVTSRGAPAGDKTGTTHAISPNANIPAGSTVILTCVSDNVQTTDGASTGHAITDTDGHTWIRDIEHTESSGAAGDGCTVSVWRVRTTSQISTSDTITLTVTGAGSNPAMAFGAIEVVFTNNEELVLRAANATNGSSTTPTAITNSSLPNVYQLHIGVLGIANSSSTITADGDYAALNNTATSGGSGASNVVIRTQQDLKSGTSSDQWNPTQSSAAPYVSVLCSYEALDVTTPTEGFITRAKEATAADASSYTTHSVRIVGDGVLLVLFNGVASGSSNEPTVSGLGLTWTKMRTEGIPPASARRVTTFKGVGTPSLGAVTVDFDGQVQSFGRYLLCDVFDADMTNFEVQENGLGWNSSFVTTANPTLPNAFARSDNYAFAALLHGGTTPNSTSWDANLTEMFDDTITGESLTISIVWDNAEDTSMTATWTNSGHYVWIAHEFARASGDAVAMPSSVARTASIPASAGQGNAISLPATVAPTAAVPAVTAAGTGVALPAGVSRSTSVPAAVGVGDAIAFPATVQAAATVPQATGSTADNAVASPATVQRTTSVPGAQGQGTAVATSPAVVATATTPTTTGIGAAVASPTTVSAQAAVPQATGVVEGAGVASPATVVATASVPAALGVGSGIALPGAVSRAASIPAPTGVGSALAQPSTVAGFAAQPAAQGVGAGLASPAQVPATAAVLAATAFGGGAITHIGPFRGVLTGGPIGTLRGSGVRGTLVTP